METRWYAFGAAEGESYETSIDPCSRRATVESRTHRYEGPAGVFPWALRIVYPPGVCMDAGLTEEIFFPWTGLLRRTETTIAGPRTYDLIYARTGGVTVISQPETAILARAGQERLHGQPDAAGRSELRASRG